VDEHEVQIEEQVEHAAALFRTYTTTRQPRSPA